MDFNVGDKVFVKLWDEMCDEDCTFIDYRGDICEKGTSYSFNKAMKRFCGSAARVNEITERDEIYLVFNEKEKSGYIFREWMLEPAEEGLTVYFAQKGDE